MKNLGFVFTVLFATHLTAQLPNTVPPSGPVGIGTGSPVSGNQLTVNGNSKMIGSIEISGNTIITGQTVMNTIVRMPGLASYAGTLNEFEVLVTDEFGNVTRTNLLTLVNGLSSLPVGLDHCSAAIVAAPHWFSAPSKLFSACPDIFVGVGTANPEYLLHVEGTSFQMRMIVGNASGPSEGLINGFTESPSQHLMQLGKKVGDGAGLINLLIKNDGSAILTNVGSSVSLTLNNGTGHAIVVNNSSGDKIFQLHDNGLLRSREIKVDIDTWPDYVFDKNYQLIDLKMLALYIQEHHKLPGIPSSFEIEKNGLNLGQIQKMQMEKIEELTLYTIQQSTQINNLMSENDALKNEMQSLNDRLAAIEKSLTQK